MKRRIPILLYHGIDKKSSNQWTVELELFEKQMAYLDERGFQTLSLSDFSERRLPEKSLILTFDDGFKDNYLHVYPVLQKHGFRATFFLTTDSVGTPSFMGWDQVREMSEEGMFFGAHTLSHPDLLKLDSKDAKVEVEQSKKIIEDKVGRQVDFFSYPYSNFDDNLKEIVKDAGYKGACTTFKGMFHSSERAWRRRGDLFAIPRLETSTRSHILDILEFKIKTSGWYII
jgi:peptidoglycan/xylan/chitin deacetylase (PgdA/CDA1 family)